MSKTKIAAKTSREEHLRGGNREMREGRGRREERQKGMKRCRYSKGDPSPNVIGDFYL